jgi:hypothetical protein
MRSKGKMLDSSELRTLTAWCARRDLRWTPARPDGGVSTMLLEARAARVPWQRMLLVFDEPDMRLENELGETLASASDLPALLDAVDGGVAEPASLDYRAMAGMALAPVEGLGFIA